MAFSEDENSLHDVTNNMESSSSHHSQRLLEHGSTHSKPDSLHSNDKTNNYLGSLLLDGTTDTLAKHSLDYEEEKSWNKMDSVHSKASTVQSGLLESGNASFDFNDSMASFASFGGSDSDLGESTSSLSEHRATFTLLQEDTTLPPPRARSLLLSRSASTRMSKGLSFRRGSLTLIDEKEDSM